MAMANLAPPNQNDPNDPAQKTLTGPIQRLQFPMFRNFQEFAANPFVQDRVSAMIGQTSPPPFASMAASMQARGQTPAQPFSPQPLPPPASQPALSAPAPPQPSMGDGPFTPAIDRYQNPFGNPLPPRPDLFSIGTSKLGGAIRAIAPYTSGPIPSSLARLLFVPKQQYGGQ